MLVVYREGRARVGIRGRTATWESVTRTNIDGEHFLVFALTAHGPKADIYICPHLFITAPGQQSRAFSKSLYYLMVHARLKC